GSWWLWRAKRPSPSRSRSFADGSTNTYRRPSTRPTLTGWIRGAMSAPLTVASRPSPSWSPSAFAARSVQPAAAISRAARANSVHVARRTLPAGPVSRRTGRMHDRAIPDDGPHDRQDGSGLRGPRRGDGGARRRQEAGGQRDDQRLHVPVDRGDDRRPADDRGVPREPGRGGGGGAAGERRRGPARHRAPVAPGA